MSFVTLIKDYVDVANSSEQLDGSTFSSLAYYTLSFIFSVLKQVIVYCFTFQWFRNFSYFCLTPPQLLSSFANVTGIEHQPLSNLVAFSETDSYVSLTGIGLIFLGFFNGCCSCMHISAVNLVTIQRMLVQGVPAGLCSAFGTALGQCSFLACILFGFRGFLFPWLALEPLPFLLGTAILLIIASITAQDRRTPTIQWSAKSYLLIYTFTNVILAWCEQTAIFQLMGNMSLGTDSTLLETTPSFDIIHTLFGNVQQSIQNISYLLAFFLGNFLGTFFLGFFLQRLLELLLRSKGIPVYYGLIKQANLPLATLIFAFGFGSLPYYGFDYLITKGFGFVSQEQFFKQTLFSPVNLVSKTSQTKEPSQGRLEDQLALLFTLEGEKNKSFVIDTTPFDDGQYLKVGQKRPQAFEDLNYRGEHLWTNRLSRISNIREQANQTQSSFLGPVFSWMRSFLWGDEPATNSTEMNSLSNKTLKKSSLEDLNSNEFHFVPKTQTTPATGVTTEGVTPVKSATGESNEMSYSTNSNALDSNEFNEIFVGNIKQKKELSPEKEQTDNYVKEFDRQFDKGFSNFYNAEPTSLIEVEDQWQEKRIKEKCYTNPIYKFLLNTEIDSFLARQPNNHWLSPQEEVLLLKRRQLLSNYYDTLSLTSQVSTSEALGQLVPKSYTNAIYNHQFKGTLKTARRLFSIKKSFIELNSNTIRRPTIENSDLEESFNSGNTQAISQRFIRKNEELAVASQPQSEGRGKQLREKTRVVKFDQPLFSKGKNNIVSIGTHEELNFNTEASGLQGEFDTTKDGQSIDSVNNKSIQKTENLFKTKNVKPNIFLLEQADPLPLYASWDEDLRKLILTNRFQSQIVAGYTYNDFANKKFNSATNQREKKSFSFTTWPLPNPVLPLATTTNINQVVDNESVENQTLSQANKPLKEASVNNANTSLNSFQRLVDNVNVEVDDSIDSVNNNKFSNSNTKNSISKSAEREINQNTILKKPTIFVKNLADFFQKKVIYQNSKNQFLFQIPHKESFKEPATNDMINALLQWQKLIKENKQLSKEDKHAAKEKVSYWPKNVRRANWSNDLIDNDMEFDEPTENVFKKQTILWEFTPPNYGGFVWPGSIRIN